MNNLLKRLLVVASAVLTLGLVAGPALAASPHLVKGPTVTPNGNSLVITATVAGLGNVTSVEYNLDGTVDVTAQCYNRGNHHPAADNKQETVTVSQTGNFPVSSNGRANIIFTIAPLSTLDCPGNQVVRITLLTYSLHLYGPGVDVTITNP